MSKISLANEWLMAFLFCLLAGFCCFHEMKLEIYALWLKVAISTQLQEVCASS